MARIIHAAVRGESLDDMLNTRNANVLYPVARRDAVGKLDWADK